MSLVIDASVAMKWLVESEHSAAARDLIGRAPLVAPDLITAEVGNALWRYVSAGHMTAPAAKGAMSALTRTLDQTYSLTGLAERALAAACDLGHPAYDCFYLVLAEQLESIVVTADRRLIAKLSGTRWQSRVEALA